MGAGSQSPGRENLRRFVAVGCAPLAFALSVFAASPSPHAPLHAGASLSTQIQSLRITMKFSILPACISLLALAVPARPADDEVQALKLQLQQMQEDFAKTRQQQQHQIDALTKKLDALTSRSE